MIIKLASLARCAQVCGLLPHEMVVGVSPDERHVRMLERYRGLSRVAACARLVSEIREALAAGAFGHAADLMVVLRIALAQAVDGRGAAARRRGPVRLARMQWLPNADYLAPEQSEREGRGCVVVLDAVRRSRPA